MGLLRRLYYQSEVLPRIYDVVHEQWENARYLVDGYRFDSSLAVDTTEVIDKKLLGDRCSRSYVATRPAVFHRAMHRLIDRCSLEPALCDFVDLGSGKGRAVMLASDYPFRHIVGIERDLSLHETAQRNLAVYRLQTGRGHRVELLHADARDYRFGPTPQVVYLYDPFDERVLMPVVGNLARAVHRARTNAYVIYHQPLAQQVLRSRSDVDVIDYDIEDDVALFRLGWAGSLH
ncbi:MAG: hypothetical protein KC503_06615 [Myxococcales bacterium]|nr:hypothetical protein [Myxococcales bacterium]